MCHVLNWKTSIRDEGKAISEIAFVDFFARGIIAWEKGLLGAEQNGGCWDSEGSNSISDIFVLAGWFSSRLTFSLFPAVL